MSTELATSNLTEEQIDSLLQMDVNNLTVPQRNQYLWWFAKRQGLDPMTKPFDIIPNAGGKLILYANRTCAEQLRKLHNINLEILERGFLQIGAEYAEVFVVRSRATLPNGRSDEALGAVPLRKGADPDTMSNAVMKCETKAKRRVTLSIMGLGLPDESEVEGFGQRQRGEPLTEPKRIFPQNVETFTPWQQPMQVPPRLEQVGTGEDAEFVNTKTGEITEALKDLPVKEMPVPVPTVSKYPPAVPPVTIKK